MQHEEGCLWKRQDVPLTEACTCGARESEVEFEFDTPDPDDDLVEFVRRCRRGLLGAAMEQSKGAE